MVHLMPARVHFRPTFLAAITLGGIALLATGSPAFAMQDEQKDSESDQDVSMRVIAGALKSAVKSGDLSMRDAYAVWAAFESEYEASVGDDGKSDEPKQQSGVSSLRKIGDVRTLLRPDFLRRDIELLRDELDLEHSQMILVETLLENYVELFEMVSDPLEDAMERYERGRRDRWISRALARVNLTESLQATMNDVLADLAEKEHELADYEQKDSDDETVEEAREKIREYANRLNELHDSMGSRLLALRGEYEGRLSELERPGNSVDGDDLVRLSRVLRDERERLRIEFVEYLELVTKGPGGGQLKRDIDSVMHRLRIEHDFAGGLLGGESIDLRAVTMDMGLPIELEEDLLRELVESDTLVATALAKRTEARIRRELIGLEVKAQIDRARDNGMGGWDSLTPGDVRKYVRACETELGAAIQVRDLILNQLALCAELIGVTEEQAGMAFRDAGLRAGFRWETNEQWAERVLRAAVELESLDLERLETLVEIELVVDGELRALREAAIADRIRIDPIRARAMIDEMSEPGTKGADTYAELRALFRELNEDYREINDRTDEQLLALLTPEELEQLPSRRRDGDDKKDYDKKDYDKSAYDKGGSGKGASGKGASGKGASGK